MKNTIIPVVGTQTNSTASWTGNLDLPSLYDGLTIAYFLPQAGVSSTNVTLELTLSDGSTTGAINCYYNASALTTHYPTNSTIVMTYWNKNTIGTEDNRWCCNADYNSNTNTWRPIQVNGTQKQSNSTSSGAANFINGTNTTVSYDSGVKIDATDEKVLQQNSISGKYRPLLMGYDEINSPSDYSTTSVTNKTFKSQKLFFTPSNCTLTFYNETTTSDNIPITFDFDIKDTTTGKTYSTNAYMKWYQDHGTTTSGLNMVIQSGGGMFLGGGEAPNKHYLEKITDKTDPDNPVRINYTGEETFITSDSPIHIQTNAGTITNRKGL